MYLRVTWLSAPPQEQGLYPTIHTVVCEIFHLACTQIHEWAMHIQLMLKFLWISNCQETRSVLCQLLQWTGLKETSPLLYWGQKLYTSTGISCTVLEDWECSSQSVIQPLLLQRNTPYKHVMVHLMTVSVCCTA